MKEVIIANIAQLKRDIELAKGEMRTVSNTSVEYAYWNGIRTQSEIILERFKKTFEKLLEVIE